MSEVPRLKLDELLLEVEFTSKRYLLVEGPTDKRFFSAWVLDIEVDDKVIVTCVEDIEIDDDLVLLAGLNDSNRSRVIVAAKQASNATERLVGIADRDCGHGVEENACSALKWTDFPSLESYAVEEEILDRANLLGFSGKLPAAREYFAGLSFALAELFCVRLRNEHLPAPKYDAGFARTPRDLATFDVARAVDTRIRSEVGSYERPNHDDVRTFAYGHDVAELLLAAYGNALKNQAGLQTREAVEGALLSAVQIVGKYKHEPLFAGLAHWIASEST